MEKGGDGGAFGWIPKFAFAQENGPHFVKPDFGVGFPLETKTHAGAGRARVEFVVGRGAPGFGGADQLLQFDGGFSEEMVFNDLSLALLQETFTRFDLGGKSGEQLRHRVRSSLCAS